jgi:two-component system cell cycle response regulator DivK
VTARILVVEDNPQNLKLATIILKSAGHSVEPARDAAEAERSIAVRVPDLILMDLALPGKDGYALTRELRQRPETARLPVLAVSSFAMRGDAERALVAGCSAYLTKPIRRTALLEQVERLLQAAVPRSGAPGPATDGPPPVPPDLGPRDTAGRPQSRSTDAESSLLEGVPR